ncbi:ATP-binding protein [Nisaea sp.]|uniref:sensor histidine kinase n=1 Tax=Nisaea sp. TaxID=2024842 RepID=UPI003297BB65
MSGSNKSDNGISSGLRAHLTASPLVVAGIAFFVVLSVTLYAHFTIEKREDEERVAHHEFARAHIGQNLKSYLEARFLSVKGIAAVLENESQPPSKTEYEALARPFRENFRGVQAVNWVDSSGTARWIVPLDGNEQVRGKDLTALRIPSIAIAAARSDGLAHATSPITLLQGEIGFASYFPVSLNGEISGFINVVFRFADLLDSIAGLDPRGSISVALHYDGEYLLSQSEGPRGEVQSSLFYDLDILDRTYQIEIRSHEAPVSYIDPILLIIVVNLLFASAIYLLLKQIGLLAKSEARIRDYTEIAFDYLWESDQEQRITYLSPRFEEITGRPASDFLGRRLSECNIQTATEDGLREHADMMARKQPFESFVFASDTEDGRKTWISSSGKPRFSAGGRFLGYRGADRSINEQVSTEKRLRRAWEHAESANQAKSNFLAGMSHELRTPLNSIIGFSEIIRDQMLGPVGKPQYAEYASDVVSSGRHLLSLVDDVLDLSKIESSTFELSEDSIELADAFEFVRRGFRRHAEARGISLHLIVADDAAFIRADTRIVRQMVMNLVSNAIKFTDYGGAIKITSERDTNGSVHIKVTDTGAGIPKEHLDRVFEPFVQVRETALLSHEGSGLGLSLVKRFIELHGGTIDLVSRVGEGTSVDLTFPKHRSH